MLHSRRSDYFYPLRQKNVPCHPEDFLILDSYYPHLEIIHPLTCDFFSKVQLFADALDLHSLFDTLLVFQTVFSGFTDSLHDMYDILWIIVYFLPYAV